MIEFPHNGAVSIAHDITTRTEEPITNLFIVFFFHRFFFTYFWLNHDIPCFSQDLRKFLYRRLGLLTPTFGADNITTSVGPSVGSLLCLHVYHAFIQSNLAKVRHDCGRKAFEGVAKK